MVPPTIRHAIVIFALTVGAAASLMACSVDEPKETVPTLTPTAAATREVRTPTPQVVLPQTPGNNEFSVVLSRQLRYVWPASGAITTYFGTGHPNGIDIALDLSGDSPIRAAGAGVVSFAGGDPCCSLGNRVEVEHEGGGKTIYGHLDRIDVAQGVTVKQGDVLGLGGNTGDSFGKHLHLELYQDGTAVDPFRFLPNDQQTVASTDERLSCAEASIRLDPSSVVTVRVQPRTVTGYEVQTVAFTGISLAARTIGIEAIKDGAATVKVTVPTLPTASGETLDAALDIALAAPNSAPQEISCRLSLRSRRTLVNPPGTGAHISAAPIPPTPTPTNTPVIGSLKTPTPRPTSTPFFVTPAPPTKVPTRPNTR